MWCKKIFFEIPFNTRFTYKNLDFRFLSSFLEILMGFIPILKEFIAIWIEFNSNLNEILIRIRFILVKIRFASIAIWSNALICLLNCIKCYSTNKLLSSHNVNLTLTMSIYFHFIANYMPFCLHFSLTRPHYFFLRPAISLRKSFANRE